MKAAILTVLVGGLGLLAPIDQQARAASHDQRGGQGPRAGQSLLSPGLIVPSMDAARGRALFASKGCVVCHSVNGVGGQDAPALDASTMPAPMNPFEFAARMWQGAEAMVALQREELGAPIELTGQELADIIAFVHSTEEQKRLSEADFPPRIRDLLGHRQGGEEHGREEGAHGNDRSRQ